MGSSERKGCDKVCLPRELANTEYVVMMQKGKDTDGY